MAFTYTLNCIHVYIGKNKSTDEWAPVNDGRTSREIRNHHGMWVVTLYAWCIPVYFGGMFGGIIQHTSLLIQNEYTCMDSYSYEHTYTKQVDVLEWCAICKLGFLHGLSLTTISRPSKVVMKSRATVNFMCNTTSTSVALGKVKVGYLVVYNGVQWIGFLLVVLILLGSLTNGWGEFGVWCWVGFDFASIHEISCLSEGVHSAYENTAPLLMLCQGLALLEVVHAAFGLVKSGIVATVLQVWDICNMYFQLYSVYECQLVYPLPQVVGRYLILFVVLQPAEEIHNHPVVFVLFLVWSLIELFRWESAYQLCITCHGMVLCCLHLFWIGIPIMPYLWLMLKWYNLLGCDTQLGFHYTLLDSLVKVCKLCSTVCKIFCHVT